MSDEALNAQGTQNVGPCQHCHPPDGNERPFVMELSESEAWAMFRALGYWKGGKISSASRIQRKYGSGGQVNVLRADARIAQGLLDALERQTGRFPRKGEKRDGDRRWD